MLDVGRHHVGRLGFLQGLGRDAGDEIRKLARDAVDIGQRFIDGVNADSPEVRTAIAREIYASSTLTEVGEERLVALFDKIRGNYGLLAYHHSEQTGEYLHLYAQSVNDKQWRDFQFKLISEPLPKLLNIVFIADVAEPIYLPNGSIDNQHTLDWLSSYVEKLNKENDLAAAVLVAKGDSIIFERYIGYADAARTRPIGPYNRMNLGSGNKMFTALAREGISVYMVNTSDIKVSCLIEAKYSELAVRTLHDVFELGKPPAGKAGAKKTRPARR